MTRSRLRMKRFQLVIAVIALLVAVIFVWWIDDAISFHNRYLGGCWEAIAQIDETNVLTEDFIQDRVSQLELNPLQEFFHTRMRHRALLYLMICCAVIGWSGSIFLRILRASGEDTEAAKKLPTWESLVASFFLSALGGGILFLLLVSTRLSLQPDARACISEGYSYLAAASAIGCGLFVVLFFKWFEKRFPQILNGVFP